MSSHARQRLRTAVLVLGLGLGVFSTSASLRETQAPTKGGEEETGPYDVVADWPKTWAASPYIWGSQPGVFAESPNRIFIAARGELKLPEKLPPSFNGSWGSLGGSRATAQKPEMRNTIVVVDGTGAVIERWTQWDALYANSGTSAGGPHKVRISPYDPEKHVWVVNDSRHVIYKFTNDGTQLVATYGETDVAGDDERHFSQPQDVAFFADGSFVVADGLGNARVIKFDRTGAFLMQWGSRGTEPGQFRGPHGIETDRAGKVYVADRGNQRLQIFDASGKHLDTWPGLRFPNHIVVAPDGHVFVADGTNTRLLKYDPNGKLLSFWGTYGMYPGAFWELHQFSVDSAGNVYTADSFSGRVYKFTPKPGADASRLVPAGAALGGR